MLEQVGTDRQTKHLFFPGYSIVAMVYSRSSWSTNTAALLSLDFISKCCCIVLNTKSFIHLITQVYCLLL